jgi:hypothetical protein
MDLFGQKTVPNTAKIAKIREWVAATLGTAYDVVIMVSELRCSEPGCPPLETVIAVLDGPGQRRQFKIHRSIDELSEADIDALIARE